MVALWTASLLLTLLWVYNGITANCFYSTSYFPCLDPSFNLQSSNSFLGIYLVHANLPEHRSPSFPFPGCLLSSLKSACLKPLVSHLSQTIMVSCVSNLPRHLLQAHFFLFPQILLTCKRSRGELKVFHCLRSTKCTPGVCRSSYHYGLQLNTTQQSFPRGCQSIWDDKTRNVDRMIHTMGQILTNMKQEIRGSLEDAVSLSSFQRIAPKHKFFYSLFGVVPYGNFR